MKTYFNFKFYFKDKPPMVIGGIHQWEIVDGAVICLQSKPKLNDAQSKDKKDFGSVTVDLRWFPLSELKDFEAVRMHQFEKKDERTKYIERGILS